MKPGYIGRMPLGEWRARLAETRAEQAAIEALPISGEEKTRRIALIWHAHDARDAEATDWQRLPKPVPPPLTLRNVGKLIGILWRNAHGKRDSHNH